MNRGEIIKFPLSNRVCPSCESLEVRGELHAETFPYGVGDEKVMLTAVVPHYTCATCGFEYDDVEGEERRHEAVCRHLGLLSPKEIKHIRQQFGSRADFSRVTGIGEASIARWESGVQIQSAAMDVLLRLLSKSANAALVRSGALSGRCTAVGTRKFPNLDVTPELEAEAQEFVL